LGQIINDKMVDNLG